MTLLTQKSRLATVLAATIAILFGSLLTAPPASAAKADLVWYLDQDFRERLDIQGDGVTVGDITVANGQISETRGGESVGTFAAVGIDAAVSIPGGRRDCSSTMTLSIGKNSIYAMSLVATNGGLPPTKKTVYALVGGTGEYSGVRGEMVRTRLSDSRYKVAFYFVD